MDGQFKQIPWLCRFKAGSRKQAAIQGQLDEAEKAFKEVERKDIKGREDIKHIKAKLKKLTEKLGKDTAKAEVHSQAVHLFLTIAALQMI